MHEIIITDMASKEMTKISLSQSTCIMSNSYIDCLCLQIYEVLIQIAIPKIAYKKIERTAQRYMCQQWQYTAFLHQYTLELLGI